MGQVLHGSARRTAAVRRVIQHSQESLSNLAERYDLNPKTVAKWKKCTHVDDAPMGSKQPHSTVLATEEEAIIVAFRRHTLLPLDDCLYALQASIPNLMRSNLHRCLQRHDISRLPKRSLPNIRSATSISTLPKCERKKAKFTLNCWNNTARWELEHRLTKVNHSWTNGQVEHMKQTLKEATVKRYYYNNHRQLQGHLYNFLSNAHAK